MRDSINMESWWLVYGTPIERHNGVMIDRLIFFCCWGGREMNGKPYVILGMRTACTRRLMTGKVGGRLKETNRDMCLEVRNADCKMWLMWGCEEKCWCSVTPKYRYWIAWGTTKWYCSPERHSLHPYYTSTVPPSLQLPQHLLVDPPSTLVCRSRFRFGRALLGALQVRIGYKNVSINCNMCGVPETIEHVLCDCPLYDVFRYNCTAALSQWLIDLSPKLVLSYPSDPVPKSHRSYIHSVLSDFLLTIRRIRQC